MGLELQNINLNLDTFESIFNKYGINFKNIQSEFNKLGVMNYEETFVAKDGQTEFKLQMGRYQPTCKVLSVTIDNVPQFRDEGFRETSDTTFEVTEPLYEGQVVRASYYDITRKSKIVYVNEGLNFDGQGFTDSLTNYDDLVDGGSFSSIE